MTHSGSGSSTDDPRQELADIAASLRAYLEWQESTGASGIPRRPKGALAASAPAPSPAPSPAAALERAPEPAPPKPAPDRGPADGSLEAAAAPAVTITMPAFGSEPSAPVRAAPTAAAAPARVATPSGNTESGRARLAVMAGEVAQCTKCGLAATRTQTVFARGNPEAKLCFVGEAPGADEDAQGVPFVGKAGQLLHKMIAAMGLSPENDVYVCNIIKCRPPGNRRPMPEETETCIPYLHEQLAIVQPRVIVALGNTAVSALLGTNLGITKIRGQWKLYKGSTLVMPTYHPSYLLRTNAQQAESKREAWDDLQSVMKELGLTLPRRT